MVVIVDYDAGNIGSIRNMLRRIGSNSKIASDPDAIDSATHIILPDVGSFDFGMQKLNELQILEVLKKKTLLEKIPTLGICLGAQLMCSRSEEGVLPGLGWVEAEVKKFPVQINGNRFKVPHMGWDYVKEAKESRLTYSLPQPARFYFVHSYYIDCKAEKDKLLRNEYGVEFDSAFEKDNILGVQFHPEKSHQFGMELLKNFIEQY